MLLVDRVVFAYPIHRSRWEEFSQEYLDRRSIFDYGEIGESDRWEASAKIMPITKDRDSIMGVDVEIISLMGIGLEDAMGEINSRIFNLLEDEDEDDDEYWEDDEDEWDDLDEDEDE